MAHGTRTHNGGLPTPSIPRLHASEGAKKIHKAMLEAGGVIIEGFLTPEQARQLERDIDEPFAALQMGSKNADPELQDFHGFQTKRLTNLVTHSRIFREEILDMNLVYEILDLGFAKSKSQYWMNAAQAIEINPGNKAQVLHRDQVMYPVFDLLGPTGPECTMNFLIALTDFTEENGATRVIPGSHKWPDYTQVGHSDMTIPALPKAGDAILLSGKTVHGGGANKTADVKRRAVGFSFGLGYLTPEEAYPFQISMDIVKKMSTRAQRMIGFRSVYPDGGGGLWQVDYTELAEYIGLNK